MTITTSIPPHLKGDLSYLSHHEAAYGRLRALLDMLSFLAAIPDHGTPSTKVLGAPSPAWNTSPKTSSGSTMPTRLSAAPRHGR